jgi:hypothetical protein
MSDQAERKELEPHEKVLLAYALVTTIRDAVDPYMVADLVTIGYKLGVEKQCEAVRDVLLKQAMADVVAQVLPIDP